MQKKKRFKNQKNKPIKTAHPTPDSPADLFMHSYSTSTPIIEQHTMTIEITNQAQLLSFETTLFIAAAMIDPDALFGACIGAWVLTSRRRNLRGWQYTGTFLLSASVGYLFAPVAPPHLTGLSTGITAFICALIVIPFSIKTTAWVNRADIAEIIRRLRPPK